MLSVMVARQRATKARAFVRTRRQSNAARLYDDPAGILKIASEGNALSYKDNIRKRLESMTANDNQKFEPSVQLVAGVGFEPTTFGL
jgi:hypothetical protein